MTTRKRRRSNIFLVSVGVHLALAIAIAAIPQQRLREVIAIAMADAPHTEDKPKRPAEPSPERPPPRAVHATSALRAIAADNTDSSSAKAQAPYLDLGLSLDSASSDGLAIPSTATILQKQVAIRAEPAKPKVLLARTTETVCNQELVKPVALNIIQPQYTLEAERAAIEGKVRLLLHISESGDVESAEVLKGLGYGLDEAAIEAVKRMKFKPASRCGHSTPTTFTLSVRYNL